jgi:para-nitrobenzyl esterase
VPLLVGHNADEWRLFLALGGLVGAVTDELASAAMAVFGPGPDAEARIRAAHPDADAEQLFVLVHSDRMFRMPSLQLARAHTAGGGRSHLYELTWPAPGSGGVLGACHALDVPLVFGTLEAGLGAQLIGVPVPAAAAAVSAQMQTAWTAFAVDGDPGWAAHDGQERLTRVFDVDGGVRPYPEEASRRLWQDHPIGVLDVLR